MKQGHYMRQEEKMDKKRVFLVGFLLACSLVFLAGIAFGDDVKTRMKNRLPDIVKLKAQGLVGETSRGYLAHVTSATVGQAIIDAENRDRKAVYTRIATQQGVSLEKVETLRSHQIVNNANPGEFLQKPDGTWYQK